MRHPGRSLLAPAAVAALLAGCGLGAGKGTSGVTVTVTRNFGTASLGFVSEASVPGSETVMRTLVRHFRVDTRYGGGFVASIAGSSGNSARRDWFYYVNGIEAPAGAASTAVHRGDRIWWDLHDWTATQSVPAVVGSFPEPFLHGFGGKRLPTVIECATDVTVACADASTRLSQIGVPVGSQLLGTGSGTDSIAVIVGTWRDIATTTAARLVAEGPAASGVYARFTGGGSKIELLDPHGHPARSLGYGAGLLAATGSSQSTTPIWLVTGTDAAGVAAAAAALTPARLHDHFALAVRGAADIPIPIDPRS